MDLDGRVVLVTGATGGLGIAVTQAFLNAGARVAAVSRSSPALAGARPGLLGIAADLTVPGEAPRAAEAAVARFGRVDVLAHLLGGFDGGTPVARTGDPVWTRMFDLNVHAAFYTVRAVLPGMLEAGRGRILAVGSRTALEPAATLSAYGASKAALVALIRSVALEVKQTGVTANVVLPSVIDTPANRAADPSANFAKWVKPESIAQLLVWLANAGDDINGAAIPIYGRV